MSLALTASIALVGFASVLRAAEDERPARLDAAVITMEATVAAVDQKTREVTLEGADGKTVTITAGEEVKNLAQVEVGDKVDVEYVEMVSMEVLPPGEVELATVTTAAKKTAPLGDKPAGTVVQATTVITIIEAIDKENELVTLRGPKGNTKTVRARNPANLEKVAIGDKVKVTYSTALAIAVTEQ
jgi:hypothetical protein